MLGVRHRDQPCLDSLVGRAANPLPLFIEVGVLRVLPRGAVVSFMVALTKTIAVIPYCCTERNRSWCQVAFALLVVFRDPGGLVECSFTTSPVSQVVVLLPLVTIKKICQSGLKTTAVLRLL